MFVISEIMILGKCSYITWGAECTEKYTPCLEEDIKDSKGENSDQQKMYTRETI
jgi:hypothetical protein